MRFDWFVVSIGTQSLVIQLAFEHPLWISYEEPDLIQITFADEDLFISEDGIKIPAEKRVLTRQLMRQLPVDASDLQDAIN